MKILSLFDAILDRMYSEERKISFIRRHIHKEIYAGDYMLYAFMKCPMIKQCDFHYQWKHNFPHLN